MPEEIWKDYPEFPEYYEVSNLGKIRSKNRHYKKNGKPAYNRIGKIMKVRKDWMGYMGILLSVNQSKKYHRKRAKMVALTFIPNPENKPFINHINGNKEDDRIENLEWCTSSENAKHRVHILNKKPYFLPHPGNNGDHVSAKPVLMYDFNGNFIKRYDCVKDARKDGKGRNKVADAARGERKSAGGYIWKYETEN